MSVFDGKRLNPAIFNLDFTKASEGYYTDKYFENGRYILERLSEIGYRKIHDKHKLDIGSLAVEMQIFHRREPSAVIANTDFALAILARCTGRQDKGKFVSTAEHLDITSVADGDSTLPWQPVIKVRGIYREFALLETLYLGVLSRGSRIATNTYNILKSANGKGILFFPARFDLPFAQESDGYSYYIGLQKYNSDFKKDLKPLVSTDAQGAWWAGAGGGTVAHAYIICHLKDTAEAMVNFARHLPPEISRIALVDTNNDCIKDSLETARVLFREYLRLLKEDNPEDAAKFKLFAVRLDTSSNMIDKSITPIGEPGMDFGVNPRLVKKVREALDNGWQDLSCTGTERDAASDFFRAIKIVASGGFDEEKVAFFEKEEAPVDFYGIGSYFFSGKTNDFTADIVKINFNGKWIEMAKEGRKSGGNPALKHIKIKNGKVENS
jgi:nicotinate phosphoribosyltransferase